MVDSEARKTYGKARYWANPKKFSDAAVLRRKNMLITDDSFKKLVLTRARSRAKKHDLEFNISIDDILWNTHCPVFGFKLEPSQTRGKGNSNVSLSLDRIDSSKGYVKNNVRTISNRANKLKNNMSWEECNLILNTWYYI